VASNYALEIVEKEAPSSVIGGCSAYCVQMSSRGHT
jgi:hypothetical protein